MTWVFHFSHTRYQATVNTCTDTVIQWIIVKPVIFSLSFSPVFLSLLSVCLSVSMLRTLVQLHLYSDYLLNLSISFTLYLNTVNTLKGEWERVLYVTISTALRILSLSSFELLNYISLFHSLMSVPLMIQWTPIE